MTDLNDWRLRYGNADRLKFGTLATGFPFTEQLEIVPGAPRTNDIEHPSGDGGLFGVDRRGGSTLIFKVAAPRAMSTAAYDTSGLLVSGAPASGTAWDSALDGQDRFAAAWDADTVRERAGAVAELHNDARGRMVYGRPRNLRPTLKKLRQGWTELVCDFVTTDPLFYSSTEKSLQIALAPSSGGVGLVAPLVAPLTIAGTAEAQSVVDNAGSKRTWPVVTFKGPCSRPTLELLNASGGIAWQITLEGTLAYDETAVIDTRPWVRSVQVNGSPAQGRLRGTRLTSCRISPGTWQARYRATDNTGTSRAVLNWRDAFASM